jgi:WD40 repeat protein
VVGTQQGRVKLIDLEKNRVIWKEDVVTEGIFDLDWSSNGILAIANLTKSCVFKKYDHKTRSFSHHISLLLPDSSRCLKFNPFDQNLIAIGIFNGTTVIYDVETCQIL